jgi:hypothetical protein
VRQLRASEMVRDKGRSRKPRVTLERKITWSAIVEETGTFTLSKAARGAIPDQVGHLEI